MLFFICHIHIPGRFFLFFIKCEYFCNRFTGGIFKHWLEQIVKHNKEREERWEKEKSLYITHSILPCQSWLDMDFWDWLVAFICMSSISGLIISGLCLTIFSADHFIIPSMVIILIFLTLKKSMTLLQQIIIVSAGVVASHLESAYHITTVAEEGWSWTLAFHSFYKQRMLKNIKKYVSMGYIGFKRFIKRYFYPIFSVQSSVFSLMFSLIRHRINKYFQS